VSPAAHLAAFAALFFGLSCISPEMRVEVEPPDVVRPRMGTFSAEESLARGEYLEVARHFAAVPRAELDRSPPSLASYGRALLACGDLDRALPVLTRAIELEARPIRRAELEWSLSQAFVFWNEQALALEFAEAARRDGYGLLPGFLRFLEAIRDVDLYRGPAPGETHEAEFSTTGFDLIRLPVRINGFDSAAIVDTGAAYTILTQSFARDVGVREIPDSKAFGRGLHAEEFPLTFGLAARLDFAGFSVRDVPVMIMPDEALRFETSRGEFPVPLVLGLHLIKEFTLDLDYARHRLRLTRADARFAARDPEQNLFLSRGRLFVRASINRSGWFQMLLDTGSEPTMLTSVGVKRGGVPTTGRFYPKKLYGLGRSQAEWARVESVAIGVAGNAVRFRNLVVKEDEGALEDGILGNSFLENFSIRVDFQRMRLTLGPR
jgi:predicted aspartyl protease